MKKTLLIMALTTSIFAKEGTLMGIQLGYSQNELITPTATESIAEGVYINYDIMGMIDSWPGFGLGIGGDINGWSPKDGSGISEGQSMYTMGLMAKIGYTFDIALKLKAGYGYGVADIGVHNGGGIQYEASLEYVLYKGLGIGAKYKHSEATILNQAIDIDSMIYFITFTADK